MSLATDTEHLLYLRKGTVRSYLTLTPLIKKYPFKAGIVSRLCYRAGLVSRSLKELLKINTTWSHVYTSFGDTRNQLMG